MKLIDIYWIGSTSVYYMSGADTKE